MGATNDTYIYIYMTLRSIQNANRGNPWEAVEPVILWTFRVPNFDLQNPLVNIEKAMENHHF